jgi:hypothetical protein
MKTPQRIKRIARPLVLTLAVSIAPVAAVTAAPTASASACEAQWGSLVKERAPYTSKQITNIRSGRHHCFDRMVVDINGKGEGRPGFQVNYVKTVTKDGSGANVPLRGGAKLRIIVKAPAYNDNGSLTYKPVNVKESSMSPATGLSARSHGRGASRGRPPSGSGCGPGSPCAPSS